MQLSISLSRSGLPRLPASFVLGSIVMLVGAGGLVTPASADDTAGWLTTSGGYESDILVNPNLDPYTVPGGPFLQLDGGLGWSRPLGGGSRAGLLGRLSLQGFANDEQRRLLGTSLEGDLVWRIAPRWQLRGALGGSYFDDSVQPTAQRTGAGTDLSLTYLNRGLQLELMAGWQGTRYSQLLRPDAAGIWGTYTESNAFIAPAILLTLGQSALLRVGVVAGRTDARDPLYDSDQISGRVGLWWRLVDGLWLLANGVAQQRNFSERAPGEDRDQYGQAGIGLEKRLSAQVAAELRYTFSRYHYVLGGADDTHRVAFGITWRFGGGEVQAQSTVTTTQAPEIPRAGRPWQFRLRAPEAQRVALVGDFNAWDPQVQPMQPIGDGWWETELTLPAGSYLYAYWVDGVLVTPPAAQRTVEDGFGGYNGLHEVSR